MRSKQAGFTLIELVMVIVILGILSAVALPKFADLHANAQKAVMEGAVGSIKSASVIAHSAYLAAGTGTKSVSLEGTSVNLVNGYPARDDICKAAGLDTTSNGDFACVTANTNGMLIRLKEAGAGDVCVLYTEAPLNASPTFFLGTFKASSASCS